ncbi:MAG TPA: APC family permease, partial [Solirubrobacteraceae bacterium]|nr:APC family permease [Solirubrobacteraceae bacterium]
MASISSAGEGPRKASGKVEDKGLKKDAIGYLSNLVIGVASTAPAYSLAATLGFIVAVQGVGVHAPAVLLVAFVPMLLIAGAYRGLNRADPDAGTTFAWTTRALGPGMGWVNGWAIFLADVLVMASLAQIAGIYTFKLFGFTELGESTAAIIVAAVVWIVVMTWICYRGIELSARIQQVLLSAEIAILGAFAVVTFVKVYANHPAGSIEPALAWFNPFALKFGALIDGVLLGLFIYWGWDSGVAVNEESEDPNEGPGRAAVMSTILLVLIYVIVSAAGQAYGGTALLTNEANQSDVLSVLGSKVFGFPWDKLLIIAVLTSASASTQTTILPTARTTLSMAWWKSIPEAFGKVHARYLTPSFSTLLMGAVSIAWTIVIINISASALADSITAIGFPICFYYGFTGIACAVYYRHELKNSTRDFILLGLAP